MRTTTFSPAQQQLLRVMSFVKTDKALEEMNSALADFFAKRIDEEMDKLWDEGKIDEHTVSDWLDEHNRTPYE